MSQTNDKWIMDFNGPKMNQFILWNFVTFYSVEFALNEKEKQKGKYIKRRENNMLIKVYAIWHFTMPNGSNRKLNTENV